jgi:hypothetical protein
VTRCILVGMIAKTSTSLTRRAGQKPVRAPIPNWCPQLGCAFVTERQLVEAWRRSEYLDKEVREYERVVLGEGGGRR